MAERLLARHVGIVNDERVLATSLGSGELAQKLQAVHPNSRVTAYFMDTFQEASCRSVSDVATVCTANIPEAEQDVVVVPVRKDGEAELVREHLQQAYVALREGGTLWTATDNRDDRWLLSQMRAISKSVKKHESEEGAVYSTKRKAELPRLRSFECDVTFRHDDRVLTVKTRPGVFSHRSVDTGARAILREMKIHDGESVLDIGCGSGALALAAATQTPNGQVIGLDSCCRAIECLAASAELNRLENIQGLCSHEGDGAAGEMDVCVANPPYYSNFRIAELFLTIAQQALRKAGRLYLVTKFPEWYGDNLCRWFESGEITPVGKYYVVSAVR
jgi:16S rRNA G1207 methylase RsmC